MDASPIAQGRTGGVAWRAAGRGRPVLLMHCALAHGGAWAGVMAALADRFALRAPDLPGHGGTGVRPDTEPQAQAVADALAVAADWPRFDLVGHSFGGTAALRLALENPARVRRLVLVEPVCFAFLHDAGDPAYGAELAAFAPFHAACDRGDWAEAARLFLGRWGAGGDAPAPGLVARIPLIRAAEPAIMEAGTPWRVRLAAVARLACPLLLVRGAGSPRAVAAILRAIRATAPQAAEAVIAGAGHMAPVTHAPALARLIGDFLCAEDREEAVDRSRLG